MDVPCFATWSVIEARAHRPMTGYGYGDFDVELSFADGGDDDAIVVVAAHDDCVNADHAAMSVAFLRFSLHARPTDCHLQMNKMAMNSGCTQPTMCTFRPLIVVGTIANSCRHVHCSLWDSGCCCWKSAMESVRCTNVAIAVEFDCCQLARPNRSSMVVNCLHEQLWLEPTLDVHIRVSASFAILEFRHENYTQISMIGHME